MRDDAAHERPPLAAAETPRAQGRLLLTIPETCELLGIKKTLCWSLIQQGVIPSIRLGRLVRVPRAQLEAWIATQAGGETSHLPELRKID